MKNVICHFLGDYVMQSHWMATNKAQSNKAALVHVVAYSVPFLLLKPTVKQYALLTGTHFLIDRFRLARYVMWAKDWLAPQGQKHELTVTGMQEDVPPFLAVWLMIIVDNLSHVIINDLIFKNK